MVYNDKILGILRKSEIRKYKSMIKSIKKEFTEKKINAKIKNMALGKALSIINAPANLE